MGRLDGKCADILGSASKDNMGQVMARRFVAEGAKVLVAGRNEDILQDISGEIGGHYALCDITNREQVFALAASAVEKMGKVDIAINSTGWGLLKPFLENTEEDLEKMTKLQYIGPFFFYQAMLEVMGEGGSLIQISSATAKIMLNDHAAYMGTKAGTDHIIRCIAHEFGEKGLRANSISPGLTDTPMTAAAKETPGIFEAFDKGYPLGRINTSEDIAAAAVWLSSDECYMTGENLQVNGGLCLRGNPTSKDIQESVAKHMQS